MMNALDDQGKKGGVIKKSVFGPAMLCLLIFIAFGIFQTSLMGKILNDILYGMSDGVGWFFELITFFLLLLAVYVAMCKYGDIRIGGEDAKPDFKMWNWITMSLCGCLGTGLLFWAMGETIYHFAEPPAVSGAVALSREAGIFAVSQTMWIWSFPQFAMYTICGVVFAIAIFNYKKPLSFSPILEMTFGKKVNVLTNIIHGVTVFTMCAAVACSMGVGLMQIGAGIEVLTGIPQSNMIYLVVAVIITTLFTMSCVSGLGNGLKKLASLTAFAFIFILIYVLILGPSEFIAKIGTESFGELMTKWPQKTMILNTMAPEEKWFADWPIQYVASFIVYAPTLGMFLARLAKGRTVREFIVVNVFVRSAFVIVWIAVFGGLQVYLQSTGKFDIISAVNEYGIQSTIFLVLSQFPLGKVLIVVFLLAIFTAFSTMADPIAAVLATFSTRNQISIDEEAPKVLKITIGVTMGIVAYVLVLSGGVGSVKGMWMIIGLPIAFLIILMMVSLFKGLKKVYGSPEYLVDESEAQVESPVTPVVKSSGSGVK